VSGQTDGLEVIALGHDHGPGRISEEDATGAVLPVHHPGRFLGADYQDILHILGSQISLGDIQSVKKSGAGAVDVHRGTRGSYLALDDAAQTGSDIFVHHIGADDEVYLLGSDSGILHRLGGGCGSQILQILGRYHTPLVDTCPGDNPLVTRIQEVLQHGIGHCQRGTGASCSNDLHISLSLN